MLALPKRLNYRSYKMQFTFCDKKPPRPFSPNPKFGTAFAPHQLRLDLGFAGEANAARIEPYGPEPMAASNVTLHYGQSIFEGMKAFRQKDGSVAIFRPDLHAKRFRNSARRMAMPELSEQTFIDCLKAYVGFEHESVPTAKDHALYLRPLMIAKDEKVKVGRSENYTFYIMSCVVGSYLRGGPSKGARVLINRQFVRAAPGGLGEAKTAANYAASLWPQTYAEKLGADQVLFLDAIEHQYIDELGGMNVFFVRGQTLLTPALNGCILNGVTRRSILQLAPQLGLEIKEERLAIDQVIREIREGRITEAFACGTAAVIQPIGEFLVEDEISEPEKKSTPASVKLAEGHPVANRISDQLTGIQHGEIEGPPGWMLKVANGGSST